jgi:hypothetical protein
MPLIDVLHYPPLRATSEQSQKFRRSLILSLPADGARGLPQRDAANDPRFCQTRKYETKSLLLFYIFFIQYTIIRFLNTIQQMY